MPRPTFFLGVGVWLARAASGGGFGKHPAGQCPVPRPPGARAIFHEGCFDRRPDCEEAPRDADGRCLFPAAEECIFTCGLCDRLSEIAACRCSSGAGELLPQAGSASASAIGPVAAKLDAVFKRALGVAEGWGLKTAVHSSDPWVIEVSDLITPQELRRIEELRVEDRDNEHKLHESGGARKVVVNDCMSRACKNDPVIVGIYGRVSDLLGIPSENFESFEMLRYRPGERYWAHDDAVVPAEHNEVMEALVSGPRLLTMIFSFRNAAEGGETCFPRLDLCFKLPPGTALLWADVRDGKPPRKSRKQASHRRRRWTDRFWAVEDRTTHAAMDVKRGEKFNANFWVHPAQFALVDAAFGGDATDSFQRHCLATLYDRKF